MMGLVVIPYIQQNGAWTLSDDTMVDLWRRMVDQKTAKKVFYEGIVQNEQQWLAYVKAAPQRFVTVTYDDEASDMAMVAWMTDIDPPKAITHFNVFKPFWGKKAKEVTANQVEYWFGLTGPDGQPLFDLLIGVTPENNPLAVRMAKSNGYRAIGTIPMFLNDYYRNARVGGVVSYRTREAA